MFLLGTMDHYSLQALKAILKENEDMTAYELRKAINKLVRQYKTVTDKKEETIQLFKELIKPLDTPEHDDISEWAIMKKLQETYPPLVAKAMFKMAIREGYMYERHPGYWVLR